MRGITSLLEELWHHCKVGGNTLKYLNSFVLIYNCIFSECEFPLNDVSLFRDPKEGEKSQRPGGEKRKKHLGTPFSETALQSHLERVDTGHKSRPDLFHD